MQWQFEYGPTASYGSKTPLKTIAAGNGVTPVEAAITGLPGDTLQHFRIFAKNDSGESIGADMTFTTPLSPWQTWAAEKFGSHAAPGSGPEEDFDADGVTNFQEYAFAGDPLIAGPVSGLPSPERHVDGGSGVSYLALVWEQNPAAAVNYVPEGSMNLLIWETSANPEAGIVIQDLPGNRKRAVGTGFQTFLRLRASLAP